MRPFQPSARNGVNLFNKWWSELCRDNLSSLVHVSVVCYVHVATASKPSFHWSTALLDTAASQNTLHLYSNPKGKVLYVSMHSLFASQTDVWYAS